MVRAPRVLRERHVTQHVHTRANGVSQITGTRGERRLTAGRQGDHVERTIDDRRLVRTSGVRRLPDDDVGVRAAEPEGADTGCAGAAAPRPRGESSHDLDWHVLPRDVRTRRVHVQVRRERLVLQRQHDLEQPRDAGSGLEMADVGLEGPDAQRRAGVAAGVYRRERLDLDRIAQRRARPVRLDIVDIGGRHAGPLERGAQHGHLRGAVRGGEAAARPVLVHRAPANHRDDAVAVGLRVRQALEHHHAAAFAPDESVGGRIERLAASIGRQHAGLREQHAVVGRQDEVDASRNGHPAVAGPQALASQVRGDQ